MEEKNKNLTEEEKIRLIQEAYEKFAKEIKNIEKERDEKILEIMRAIDEEQLFEVRKNLKNSL